jgi:hypothetical protein
VWVWEKEKWLMKSKLHGLLALGVTILLFAKSKREIIRCLKRYVAREAYRVLVTYGTRSSPTGP